MFHKDNQKIYRVGQLEAFDWLVHGFGTRWSSSFGSCRNLATLHQVHSDLVVDARGRSGVLGDGDALVENTAGRLVGVKSADCVPILLVDERRRVVAAVHAGWRGTAQHIVQHTVRHMITQFSSNPADLHAAIGPAIGKCCYEVGADVAVQFAEFDPELSDRADPAHLDLAGYNQRQLEQAGVAADRIYQAGICTRCDAADFFSWRREKNRAGRMLSVIGLK